MGGLNNPNILQHQTERFTSQHYTKCISHHTSLSRQLTHQQSQQNCTTITTTV